MTEPVIRGACFMPLCGHQASTRIGLLAHLVSAHDIEQDEPDDSRSTWVDQAIQRAFPPEP